MNFDDWVTHIADTLQKTSHWLKKSRDLKNYLFVDSEGNERQVKTKDDLKQFMLKEIELYQQMILEIDEN